MTIWLASGNIHKKKEFDALFPGHEILSPKEAGIDFNPDETGNSFLDNALLKARELYKLLGQPVLADDSGLCVDALGGRPGIYSARYGSNPPGSNPPGSNQGAATRGQALTDAQRNELLLREVGSAPNRTARFVCAMALVLSLDRFIAVQETLEGELAQEELGAGGFGYDPILYLPELGKTLAELSMEEKNMISHRAKAARRIALLL